MLSPVSESHIPTLLLDSAQLKVESVPLDVVRGGHDVLVAALTSADQSGIDVLAPDVETNDDLCAIARALRATASGRICAGSAGLAEHLARPDPYVSPTPRLGAVGPCRRGCRHTERAHASADRTRVDHGKRAAPTHQKQRGHSSRGPRDALGSAGRARRDF